MECRASLTCRGAFPENYPWAASGNIDPERFFIVGSVRDQIADKIDSVASALLPSLVARSTKGRFWKGVKVRSEPSGLDRMALISGCFDLNLQIMRLFFIHGAPATGKFTVARELSLISGTPLVDNHAAIDMAKMVFGFAQSGFWDLVHDLRMTTLRGAAKINLPRLITTAAYSHPVEDYGSVIKEFGGVIEPIHLYCSEETLMDRVSASERLQKGKIASPEGLKRYLDRNNFVAMPRDKCLSLSTESTTPEETAVAIAQHFEIPIVSTK